MSQSPRQVSLDPEKVAYWYFRLNGFLQIKDFVVHPERQSAQRANAQMPIFWPFGSLIGQSVFSIPRMRSWTTTLLGRSGSRRKGTCSC